MKRILSLFAVLQIFLLGAINGQGISEYAADVYLKQANGQAYMSPLMDVIGASINSSALSYTHPDSNKRYHFYIGAYATAAFIPESMKSFNGITEAPFTPAQTVTAPTILGKNETQTIYDAAGHAYTFAPGFDIQKLYLAFPVVHIGTLFHTNFSGRYFAIDLSGDLKRVETFGIGFNHFISDYWHAKNYFISVGGNYNQFSLGSYMKGQNFMAQLAGGQQIRKFNYWAYGQWQQSPYEFYFDTSTDATGTVKINGEQNLRFGAGCSIQLWKFNIRAEASGFKPLIASGGIGLQF